MKIHCLSVRLAFVIALSVCAASTSASVLSVAGNDTLVGNRPANLITNGSFEADGGVATNGSYWATGTSFSPTMSLSGWTASGPVASYAYWGSDGFGGIKSSAMFPDGTNGLYFGAGIMASVVPYPTEANDGLVTFTSTPTITPKPTDGPVTLQQTVSGLDPSATYLLDFWTSGELVGQPSLPVDGFFGLDITGESRLYFAAPSGNGLIGPSQRYQVYFKPTASTVTFTWINWGHYFSPNGLSDELVLDDVILNQLPDPAPPVDCACVAALAALQTNGCPAYVPDLCALAAGCFTTNMLPGSCVQNPPPGTLAGPGTNLIVLAVMDSQSNLVICPLNFVVTPPPNPVLTLNCAPNKAVECGSGWMFDAPIVNTTCCDPFMTVNVIGNVTNGTCPQIITRVWQVTNTCGLSASCSQTVTNVDTTPPTTLCSGVNLVPNGNFEFYSACPTSGGQISLATPWFGPTDATSDYFHSCASLIYVSTPTNTAGGLGAGVQIPLSGQAYAGVFVYGPDVNVPGSSYREYLEVPLISTLAAGQTYRVSFYVSRAENYADAIADIGAYFSSGPVISNGYTGVLNFVPQVVNPATNLLLSTTAWMLVQGTFVAAGGESHLTLGNFLPDAGTTVVPASGLYTNDSFYYFDDVSVEPICPATVTNKVAQCGSSWTFDAPIPFDQCSGTNVNVSISTVTNGACPKIITRAWTLTDLCGNTNTWSQTVTVVDTNPPVVLCLGANLVPNPDFESYTNCPGSTSEFDFAAPWFNPTGASPDYFNACAPVPTTVSVPANFGGVQAALSGQGYGGAILYTSDGGDLASSYREYIEVPLLAPLAAGQTYLVSFQVNLADFSGYAMAEIGACFSAGPLVDYATQTGLPVAPQVVNPANNLLTSTNGWMLVQGIFTAAGGEDHLTLGNFLSDAATTAVPAAGTQWYAYYYFEDVSVAGLCDATGTNSFVPCGSPFTFNPPIGFDACSGTNVTVAVAGTVTNSLCPLVVVRNWTLTDLCGNTNTWSQTVTVVDNSPPVVNCGCLQDSILTLLSTNACTGIVPDFSVLTNSPCISDNCGPLHITQSPPAGTLVGPGVHSVTNTISDCSGNSAVCVLPFYVNAQQPTITCPPNLVLLTCTPSAVASFNVSATGNTGTIVCSPPSGSAFPLGTNVVTCTATNDCGGVATCTFTVIVRPPYTRWGCIIFVIGIPVTPIGTATAFYLPPLPGGGIGVDLGNLGSSGQDGMEFDFGPAQKFTFSTVLDFNAPAGAGFDLVLPPDGVSTSATTLLSFHTGCQPACGWNITRPRSVADDPGALYRSIAIGNNGELLSSFTQNAATLGTNILANLTPAPGVTGVVMTVTLDCRTREVSLDFPFCNWTLDTVRKGWDGLIYGNGPRGETTNRIARLILTPLAGATPPPITALDLLSSNLTSVAFDNPTLDAGARGVIGHDHVSLMKAYDDGTDQGVEFLSVGDGGGVTTDLGHAAGFQLRIGHFETGDVPTEEQLFGMIGWPAGGTAFGLAPPTNWLRLAQGSAGIDCAADFAQWGVSNVTLQLWNGSAKVNETNHVPAALGSPLASLSGFPASLGCPAVGVLSLGYTNPLTVLSGLDCSSGCVGTELRILAELPPGATPPVAFTGLEYSISDGMDNLIYGLQTAPACSPVPLTVTATRTGLSLSWDGDGFRLQGAETARGPWYDLGVSSPVTLPPNSAPRFFRLLCD